VRVTPPVSPPTGRYRWLLHRLWIAAGNEALAYTQATGQPVRADRIWANLYDLRNHLAHSRLPDIDEALVQRFTWARLDSLQTTVVHSQTWSACSLRRFRDQSGSEHVDGGLVDGQHWLAGERGAHRIVEPASCSRPSTGRWPYPRNRSPSRNPSQPRTRR
jgi:hypothetical protein